MAIRIKNPYLQQSPYLQQNPNLQQILFQNQSASTIQLSQLKDSAQLISSAMTAKSSMTNISAAGSKMNDISKTIKNSGDMQSYKGFQAAMQRANSSGDPLQMTRFINSADYAAKEHPTALNGSFSSLAKTMGQNNPSVLDGFNKAFSSTIEKTGVKGLNTFNQAFSKVESASYTNSSVSLADNVKEFFSTAAKAVTSGKSEKESISNLQQLAKGVEISENADKIYHFFKKFTGAGPKAEMA